MIKRMCRLGLATRQNERDSLEKNEDVEGYEAANRNPQGIYVFCMISFLVSADRKLHKDGLNGQECFCEFSH